MSKGERNRIKVRVRSAMAAQAAVAPADRPWGAPSSRAFMYAAYQSDQSCGGATFSYAS
ncbi:hypothetical protein GA0070624_3521 [Micromonospora rhizosphaerae]|uniref:Uncharacterized protein n=1 Tax=Micromonospora rhizosphaerae TaxID=568872 RepID=A0A1C6SDG9_9ACTN|nr:hypothetical protein GA0070624_3521 [Micromonospora rhizosphaerae]